MMSSLFRWFRSHRSTVVSRTGTRKKSTCKLLVETLEDRSLLSAGALDPTFGTGGLVHSTLGSTFSRAHDVLIQPGGTIVAAGTTQISGPNQDFALVRYNPDGSVASTVTTDFNGGLDSINAVALQSDGKIVAAGGAGAANQNWAVSDSALARYNANGTLDASFGGKKGSGKVSTNLINGYDRFNAVAIQPDGKIVAAGYSQAIPLNTPYNLTLARYNTDGSLDSTFGSRGVVTVNSLSTATGVAIQNGKILVSGDGFAVARFNSNGTLDTTFGTQGTVPAPVAGFVAKDMVVQADGRILVSGVVDQVPNAGEGGFLVARYQANGAPDTGFGTAGIAQSSLPTGAYDLRGGGSLALQGDGKIVIAGYARTSPFSAATVYDFMVARMNANGSSDDGSPNDSTPGDSFGAAGATLTDFGPTFGVDSNDQANAIAMQADGKIVAAGLFTYHNPTSRTDFALARYLSAEPQTGSFTASPNPVMAGNPVTLTAFDVQALNPGSTITQVAFYVDTNNNGVLDAGDTLLTGTTSQSGDDWTLVFSSTGWATGAYTLFAQALDSYGVLSDPMDATLLVE